MKNKELQQQLIKELNECAYGYAASDIYTVLLDLVQDAGVEEVFMILHNVATDEGQREILESKFEEAKTWNWEF